MEATYRELQKTAKLLKQQGYTDIRLNSSKAELKAEIKKIHIKITLGFNPETLRKAALAKGYAPHVASKIVAKIIEIVPAARRGDKEAQKELSRFVRHLA